MEEDIEALCKLLATIGKKFDRPQAKSHIDSYFRRMQMMSKNSALSRRAKFMLLDAIDLRKSAWQPRRQEVEAKTIDKFRQDLEREAAVNNAKNARANSRFDTFIGRGVSPKTGPRLSRQQSHDRGGHSRGPSESFESRRSFTFDHRAPPAPNRTSSAISSDSKQEAQAAIPRPAADIRMSTVPAPAPKASASQIKAYVNEIGSLIKEYLQNPGGMREIQDALGAMSDWNPACRNSEFVSKAINISMESKAPERDSIVSLLVHLCNERVLSTNDLNKGFRETIEFLSDVICDVPHAADYLGTIYGKLIAEGMLSLNCLYNNVFNDQIEHGALGEFVSNVLLVVANEKGSTHVQEMIRNSNFDLLVFLRNPFRHAPSEFIKKHRLGDIVPELLEEKIRTQ